MTRNDGLGTRFDRAAAGYHAAAGIQARVADQLMAELPAIEPGRILEIGCGTGLLTERLAARYPDRPLEAMDLSPAMVREAARRLAGEPHVIFFAADIRRLRRKARYDLAVSSSALHWATPLETAFRRIAVALAPGGWFVAALMTEGTLGELRRLRAELFPRNLPAEELPARADVCRAVRASGLREISVRDLSFESGHASAAALLGELHAMGVTGGRLSAGVRPLTRGELERLKARYQALYGDRNGRVRAGWRAVIVVARV
jgi:malonyl-CoA O-methyltransferase